MTDVYTRRCHALTYRSDKTTTRPTVSPSSSTFKYFLHGAADSIANVPDVSYVEAHPPHFSGEHDLNVEPRRERMRERGCTEERFPLNPGQIRWETINNHPEGELRACLFTTRFPASRASKTYPRVRTIRGIRPESGLTTWKDIAHPSPETFAY